MAVGVGRPRPERCGPAPGAPLGQRGDDNRERGELLGGRLPADDGEERTAFLTHSGMFPCFFGGRVSRLFASTRSALVTCTRVCEGGMTAST